MKRRKRFGRASIIADTTHATNGFVSARTAEYFFVLFGNGLLLVLYRMGQAAFTDVLWMFWFQSVLIGACNVIRMAALRRYCEATAFFNGRPIKMGKWSTAAFFCFHYGAFHLVYAVFLGAEETGPWAGPWSWSWLGCLSLAIGEVMSLRQRVRSDRGWTPDLATLMGVPYLRIIPMHLTIMACGITASQGRFHEGAIFALFLVLKTSADLGMKAVDDHLDRKRAKG